MGRFFCLGWVLDTQVMLLLCMGGVNSKVVVQMFLIFPRFLLPAFFQR